MKIGLIDVDSHNYPNLPLMKLSAYHKAKGDQVEMYSPLLSEKQDITYMAKVFSNTPDYEFNIKTDKLITGGSGYCISLKDGLEVYDIEKDKDLPKEIEHIMPDYSLYPEFTKDTAYGFLTRGCPRNCHFCHVTQKEGNKSCRVAAVDEFWNGQNNIVLNDPNILACKDHIQLLKDLTKTKAVIDFNQGIDVRLTNKDNIKLLNDNRIYAIHMAWDNPNEDLTKYFEQFTKLYKRKSASVKIVYVLTNFDSTHEQDLYRIYKLREMGYDPYVMIYDRDNAPKQTRKMQRWVNNRFIWRKCKRFEDYEKDGIK